jgi:hypothetical protein
MSFERDETAVLIRQSFDDAFGPWQLQTDAGGVGFFFDGTAVGVLAGAGASAVVSAGQLTDNSTGTPGTDIDATADGTTNNNFARLVARVNQLEAQVRAFGLLS